VPGTHPFRAYAYGTSDPLEQVLPLKCLDKIPMIG
jgi:hypothetical protein